MDPQDAFSNAPKNDAAKTTNKIKIVKKKEIKKEKKKGFVKTVRISF